MTGAKGNSILRLDGLPAVEVVRTHLHGCLSAVLGEIRHTSRSLTPGLYHYHH